MPLAFHVHAITALTWTPLIESRCVRPASRIASSSARSIAPRSPLAARASTTSTPSPAVAPEASREAVEQALALEPGHPGARRLHLVLQGEPATTATGGPPP